jgi:hypothetical protein
MSLVTGAGEPPEFDVGDRVITVRRIGGWLRPRIGRGVGGTVIGCLPATMVEVQFDDGHREVVSTTKLRQVDDLG